MISIEVKDGKITMGEPIEISLYGLDPEVTDVRTIRLALDPFDLRAGTPVRGRVVALVRVVSTTEVEA